MPRDPARERAQEVLRMLRETENGLFDRTEDSIQAIIHVQELAAGPMLKHFAESVRPCRACGKVLAFMRISGALRPYELTGVDHFLSCPNADEFRAKVAAAQRPAGL
jgi:hypothetical protein